MLDGDVTDSVEARSLSYNRDHIAIYSASWGPDDNGEVVDGPGAMAKQAFMEGTSLVFKLLNVPFHQNLKSRTFTSTNQIIYKIYEVFYIFSFYWLFSSPKTYPYRSQTFLTIP